MDSIGSMKYRNFGNTGWKVSEVSLGTWQLIDSWNGNKNINVDNAKNIIDTALDQGINFFDTADVYTNQQSEKYTADFVREQKKKSNIYVATKCGRRLQPHTAKGYNKENITKFVQDSIDNMNVKSVDLIQLHCPPTEVYSNHEVFQV